MGWIKYENLLLRYKQEFTKNYQRDKEIHPAYSILRGTLVSLSIEYYIKLFTALIYLLLPFYFVLIHSHPQLIHLIIVIPYYIIFFIVFKYFYKVPYLHHIIYLEDRVNLVREKVISNNYQFDEICDFFDNAIRINDLEKEFILKRYLQLIECINKSRNQDFPPLARIICLDSLINIADLQIGKGETKSLISFLLRIGEGNSNVHFTNFNIFKKLFDNGELSESEKGKLTQIQDSLLASNTLLTQSLKQNNSGLIN
jgi:hypothetical protein